MCTELSSLARARQLGRNRDNGFSLAFPNRCAIAEDSIRAESYVKAKAGALRPLRSQSKVALNLKGRRVLLLSRREKPRKNVARPSPASAILGQTGLLPLVPIFSLGLLDAR